MPTNTDQYYRCSCGHVFNEPGSKPDPDYGNMRSVHCCPGCGGDDYCEVSRCAYCGEVSDEHDMTHHCDTQEWEGYERGSK